MYVQENRGKRENCIKEVEYRKRLNGNSKTGKYNVWN